MDTTEAPIPSLLLSLPAELRLRIYSFALAPTGSIYLHRTSTKRYAVTPSTISPALLATNRQINYEASGVLYTENVVHIAVDGHDTSWPAINEARLPQPVLQKLEHLCVLLDCTSVLWGQYGTVDLEAFTALTELRSLRLRALVLSDEAEEEEEDPNDPNAAAANQQQQVVQPPLEPTWKFKNFPLLAVEILERVPVSTKIFYGRDASEDEANAVATELSPPGPREPFDEYYTPKFEMTRLPGQVRDAVAREVSAEDLQANLGSVDLEGRRGIKAGTVKDVWAYYREGHGLP
jgi:hypothetical protein